MIWIIVRLRNSPEFVITFTTSANYNKKIQLPQNNSMRVGHKTGAVIRNLLLQNILYDFIKIHNLQ